VNLSSFLGELHFLFGTQSSYNTDLISLQKIKKSRTSEKQETTQFVEMHYLFIVCSLTYSKVQRIGELQLINRILH
jgi:hypothetical protein